MDMEHEIPKKLGVLAMVNYLHVIFGNGPGGLSVLNDAEGRTPMWKKKSIFWDRPYWKDLQLIPYTCGSSRLFSGAVAGE